MSRLVIVGNGFDMAHRIKSSYFDFRDFVQTNDPDLHALLLRLGGSEFWWDFEENLAKLDLQGLIDRVQDEQIWSDRTGATYDNRQDLISAGWVRRDLRSTVRQLTGDLSENLRQWIEQIDGQATTPIFTCFDGDEYFLSFNYTSTIEHLYGHSDQRMFYIHNKVGDFARSFNWEWCFSSNEYSSYFNNPNNCGQDPRLDLIYGHAAPTSKPDIPLAPVPGYLTDYDFNAAYTELTNAYNELYDFFDSSRKRTCDVMPKLAAYLQTVPSLDEVLIIGHSLSRVDAPYFERIAKWHPAPLRYTITYYTEANRSTTVINADKFIRPCDEVEFIDLSQPNRLTR